MKKAIFLIGLFALLLCACQKKESIILSGEMNADSAIALADSAYDRGDYETAIYYYLQLEDYFNQNAKGTKEQANLYNTIGRCYYEFDDIDSGKKYFEKSAEICEKLGYDELNFDNYWYLTLLYNDNIPENSNKALEFGKKSEQAAERFFGKNSSEVGETYACQGEVYLERKEYEIAKEYFQKALEIMGKTKGKESEDIALVYINMGKLFFSMEKYEESISYFQKAEIIFKNHENDFKLGQIYFNMADVYLEKKDYEKVIEYCNLCIDLYEEKNINNTDLAACHYEKSAAAYYLGDYKLLEDELVKAHKICEMQSEKSKLAKDMIDLMKKQLLVYYDNYYEGDKSSGFEVWYQELIAD